jgi:hypothetical protein
MQGGKRNARKFSVGKSYTNDMLWSCGRYNIKMHLGRREYMNCLKKTPDRL